MPKVNGISFFSRYMRRNTALRFGHILSVCSLTAPCLARISAVYGYDTD